MITSPIDYIVKLYSYIHLNNELKSPKYTLLSWRAKYTFKIDHYQCLSLSWVAMFDFVVDLDLTSLQYQARQQYAP